MSRDRRQADFYAWAVEVFGSIAADPLERASRFLEEAVELAHAVGLDRERVDGLTERVYCRPAGKAQREAGQVGVTLLALCERLGISADTEELREWARVTSIPAEEWRARQQAKAEQGLALPCKAAPEAALACLPEFSYPFTCPYDEQQCERPRCYLYAPNSECAKRRAVAPAKRRPCGT